MIYNFNRGIGWASSGVEYAQAYRGKVLRKNGYGCRFIYTDMFRIDNIALMTENIGIPDEEVIWLYQYFTDFHITRPQIRVCEFERDYLPVPERVKDPAGAYTVREADGRREYHGKDDRQIVYAYYAHGDKTIIQKADFFVTGVFSVQIITRTEGRFQSILPIRRTGSRRCICATFTMRTAASPMRSTRTETDTCSA